MDNIEKDNLPANDFSIDNNDDIYGNEDIGDNSFHQQEQSFKLDDKNDEIQIKKRVTSIRQLKNIEKELVRLNYKQAVLKGLGNNLMDIQAYILTTTHIFVERIGLEYLKRTEEEEDRKWYKNLAEDHFAYVSIYRKSIDEIDQLMKELWMIYEDSGTTQMSKIKAIRELHKLTITSIMLLRDLPFVTNLSKFYDEEILNSNYTNSLQSPRTYSNRNKEIIPDSIHRKN